MPTLGSDGGFQADNRGGIIDDQGNTIVTSDTSFAASPLGVAARTQALYGIPNANFNLTPPDPDSPIVANQNDLPYWSIEDLSDGQITATTVFDDATQTYGVELDPGTAATDSSLTLSTRSYILTDDNLALRQKALSVLSKSGTAGGTASEWNLQLSAIYYDANDTALSTAVIGTALDTATWTSFSGTTTPGGSAINSAAQYVDLTYTLATTAAVTGSVKATIKSLLLTTTSPTTGGGLLVTETFTAGTTWTKPTGVDYLVAALVVGAGGGGGAGGAAHGTAIPASQVQYTQGGGGGGGGGGAWSFVQNLYLADASYSIGIGAGGAGGTSVSYTKGIGTAAVGTAIVGGSGGVGGATTFGTVITAGGGGGGTGGSARTDSTVNGLNPAAAGTPGVPTASIYGAENYSGGTGGGGSASANSPVQSTAPFTFAIYPYVATPSNAQNGETSTISGTSTNSGGGSATSAAIGFSGGGAASPSVQVSYNGSTGLGGVTIGTSSAAKNNGGGGGAGATAGVYFSGTAGTVSVTGGNGGNAASNSGGGGGAGGGASTKNLGTNINGYRFVQSGAGGSGASGYVLIAYIA